MYDLSGLYYQMKSDALCFGLVGILFLICSRFWMDKKRNKKDLVVGLISILLCVCSIGYHCYVIDNLEVGIHEGMLIREGRDNPYLFRTEYCFSNSNGHKPIYYLDVFSKKVIYPEDLKKDITYRVYFEKKTEVILKIEKLE